METTAEEAAPEAATVLAETASMAAVCCAANAWLDGRIFSVGCAAGKRNRTFQGKMYKFRRETAAAHFEASLAGYFRKNMVLSRFILFFNLLFICCP